MFKKTANHFVKYNDLYISSLSCKIPKLKYIEYKKNELYTINNIDDDIITQNSEFLIGSITKLFTIYTFLKMQEENIINIEDRLDKYLENNDYNDFSQATIYELINHTSGIKIFPDGITRETKKHTKLNSCNCVMNTFISSALFTQNKTYNYSIIGYIVLGKILEDIKKIKYSDLYKNYIYDEFNLKNTSMEKNNIMLYHNDEILDENKYLERYYGSTGGGLHSSMSDLMKFSDFPQYLNKNSREILKKLYVFSEINNYYHIHHTGNVFGGTSSLTYIYDKNFNIKDVKIKLKTN